MTSWDVKNISMTEKDPSQQVSAITIQRALT